MPCAFMILLFATVATASTVPDQLDAILKDYGRADAPGASVLVAQDGKVLYRKAFGLANLVRRRGGRKTGPKCHSLNVSKKRLARVPVVPPAS